MQLCSISEGEYRGPWVSPQCGLSISTFVEPRNRIDLHFKSTAMYKVNTPAMKCGTVPIVPNLRTLYTKAYRSDSTHLGFPVLALLSCINRAYCNKLHQIETVLSRSLDDQVRCRSLAEVCMHLLTVLEGFGDNREQTVSAGLAPAWLHTLSEYKIWYHDPLRGGLSLTLMLDSRCDRVTEIVVWSHLRKFVCSSFSTSAYFWLFCQELMTDHYSMLAYSEFRWCDLENRVSGVVRNG